MKRFVWVLLMIGAVAQPLSRTGTFLLFHANRPYISNYLCEQRQVPTSTCQGSCFLNRQLRKESEREQQTPGTRHAAAADIILVAPALETGVAAVATPDGNSHATYVFRPYPPFARSIFHPPRRLT